MLEETLRQEQLVHRQGQEGGRFQDVPSTIAQGKTGRAEIMRISKEHSKQMEEWESGRACPEKNPSGN